MLFLIHSPYQHYFIHASIPPFKPFINEAYDLIFHMYKTIYCNIVYRKVTKIKDIIIIPILFINVYFYKHCAHAEKKV